MINGSKYNILGANFVSKIPDVHDIMYGHNYFYKGISNPPVISDDVMVTATTRNEI